MRVVAESEGPICFVVESKLTRLPLDLPSRRSILLRSFSSVFSAAFERKNKSGREACGKLVSPMRKPDIPAERNASSFPPADKGDRPPGYRLVPPTLAFFRSVWT